MTLPLPRPEPIAAEVCRIIADNLCLPVAEVTLDRRLDAAGLGIDSLGLIKLNVEIEERFDISIPDFIADDPSLLRSVGDVVNLVADCVAKAGVS